MTMVERVTRVLAESDPEYDPEWDYRPQAIAAIKAMREPDKVMIDEGISTADDCLDSDYESNADGDIFEYTSLRSDAAQQIYTAMIDAALTEAEEKET